MPIKNILIKFIENHIFFKKYVIINQPFENPRINPLVSMDILYVNEPIFSPNAD